MSRVIIYNRQRTDAGIHDDPGLGLLDLILVAGLQVGKMERAEWLEQMREKSEVLYDHMSPEYWERFGLTDNETHLAYLQKFLDMVTPRGRLLSAACGAGRYDGILLEAGHSVVGIDQSAGMLARARERFPEVRYEKIGLQEMDFNMAFDGAICIDAMEHVCPEDWPEILRRFRKALKPGGFLYFTLDLADESEVEEAYTSARIRGLPVVYGEVAHGVEEAYERIMTLKSSEVSGELSDVAVYHFYPSQDQVQNWIGQAGMVIVNAGTGSGYAHYLVRRG